jgi:hypothetical protein
MKPDFGIFEPVFESSHGYLALLHLDANDTSQAVEAVRQCCLSVEAPYPDIRQLLTDKNWRPHLVAAAALIISGYDSESVRLAWRCLDTGSWVTPQLGVALFLVDPDFDDHCHSRLSAGCPIDVSVLTSMSDVERHSASGPAGRVERSAKAAFTLLHLLQMKSAVPPWLEQTCTSEVLRTLLKEDIDQGGAIAEKWLRRIQAFTG